MSARSETVRIGLSTKYCVTRQEHNATICEISLTERLSMAKKEKQRDVIRNSSVADLLEEGALFAYQLNGI
jgi:hypothetical protein